MSKSKMSHTVCAVGDVHGHLQLALCMAARWQKVMDVNFDILLLCGDVGTFWEENQLDGTTRRHARRNPCELEFLYQWAISPPPGYLSKIFSSIEDGGLGLECPVIMVHGNHEGFNHLASLCTGVIPGDTVSIENLPYVDKGHFIRYLPSGWKCRTLSGLVIGAIGGIEKDQREADYHDMAYINDDAVENILKEPGLDILITHQGPSSTQTEKKGSPTLQLLMDLPKREIAKIWFHGHSIVNPDIQLLGPTRSMLIVPLGDAAFPGKGLNPDDPGDIAWCWASLGEEIQYERKRPDFWRDYRRNKWIFLENGQLICPDLKRFI
jgi:hypothetical protein